MSDTVDFSNGRLATDLDLAVHVLDGQTSPKSTLSDSSTFSPVNYGGLYQDAGGPYSASAVGEVFNIECSDFTTLILGVVGTFTGQAVAVETTIDGDYWFSCPGKPIQGLPFASGVAPGNNSGTSGTETVSVYEVFGKRVRCRLAAISTGTMSFFPALSNHPIQIWSAVSGVTAHSAAAYGFPVRVGGRVVTAADTTLINGDGSDLFMSTGGAAVLEPHAVPDLTWTYAAAAGGLANTTTAVTMKAAAAAGLRNYITSVQISHELLGGISELVIRDGAGGAVLWRVSFDTPSMPPTMFTFPKPLRGTAATLLEFAELTAVTGKIYVNAQGFVQP